MIWLDVELKNQKQNKDNYFNEGTIKKNKKNNKKKTEKKRQIAGEHIKAMNYYIFIYLSVRCTTDILLYSMPNICL